MSFIATKYRPNSELVSIWNKVVQQKQQQQIMSITFSIKLLFFYLQEVYMYGKKPNQPWMDDMNFYVDSNHLFDVQHSSKTLIGTLSIYFFSTHVTSHKKSVNK